MVKIFDNKNLYPTPDWLIDKMLSKVEIRGLRNILEPSAGLGNIVERVKYKLGEQNMKYCKIEAIEIDKTNLVPVLKSKGIRVIHDDFLTFSTYQKYCLIIQNPPFDSGDKHLLKAIQLQEQNGGEIVSLLNAETIKNPFSNTRKDLLNKLDRYDAEIEFIDNAFTDSMRKTDVETALVYLKIPKQRENSVIVDHLKQEEKYQQNNKFRGEIVTGDFIDRIIQQYEFEVKAGVKLINEYVETQPFLSRGFDDKTPILKLSIEGEQHRPYYDNIQNEYIRKIRYKYWSQLFQSKEFATLMTTDLRSRYYDKMEELQEYDFSKFNIEQIRLDIHIMLSKSLQNTILSLFNDFISYSYSDSYKNNIYLYNGWKTNSAYKISENRIILPMSAYDSWDNSFYPTKYGFRDRLRDMHKVFGYLDNGRTILEDDLDDILKKAQDEGQTRDIDCGYFKIHTFKKGTTHFEWTRPDIIRKLNIEGSRGRGWLPPSYGKPYNQMTPEEQDVIDSFQGKEEYNKIIQDKNFYLGGFNNLLAIEGGIHSA